MAIAFGVQIILARLLGDTEFGTHAYVVSWIMLLQLPAVAGMDIAILRYYPTLNNNQSQQNALTSYAKRYFLGTSLIAALGSSAVLCVVYGVGKLSDHLFLCLLLGFFCVPACAFLMFYGGLLKAQHKAVISEAIGKVIRPVSFLALLLLWQVTNWANSATISLAIYGLAAMICCWYSSRLVTKKTDSDETTEPAALVPEHKQQIKKTSFSIFRGLGVENVARHMDIIIVGSLLDLESVGYYAVASRLVSVVAVALRSTNAIVAPKIAMAYDQGKEKEMSTVLTATVKSIMAITLPVALCVALGGWWALWVFGKEFTVAYPALIILIVGQVISASCGCVGYLLQMTDNEQIATRIMTVNSILSVILCFLFTWLWGMPGAALSKSLTLASRNILLRFAAIRRLNVDPSIRRLFVASP